jgi:lipoyl(octanoyl) transferase
LPATFVTTLTLALQDVVQRFCPESTIDRATPGIRVRGRRLAAIGTAIRSTAHTQVSAFGAILNVNPDLDHFDVCDCDGDAKPMTSLQRESQLRARMPTVRQLLLEAIEQRFQITRVSVHHHHPAFEETARRYASTARRHKI